MLCICEGLCAVCTDAHESQDSVSALPELCLQEATPCWLWPWKQSLGRPEEPSLQRANLFIETVSVTWPHPPGRLAVQLRNSPVSVSLALGSQAQAIITSGLVNVALGAGDGVLGLVWKHFTGRPGFRPRLSFPRLLRLNPKGDEAWASQLPSRDNLLKPLPRLH